MSALLRGRRVSKVASACVMSPSIAHDRKDPALEGSGKDYARGGLSGWQRRTIERLAETEARTVNVRSLAAAARLSPHHFSRAFHRSYGVPPREWLLQVKLAHAKDRLRNSRDTVEQIAFALGYSTGSQFARVFRSRVGTSPQAYRRA